MCFESDAYTIFDKLVRRCRLDIVRDKSEKYIVSSAFHLLIIDTGAMINSPFLRFRNFLTVHIYGTRKTEFRVAYLNRDVIKTRYMFGELGPSCTAIVLFSKRKTRNVINRNARLCYDFDR